MDSNQAYQYEINKLHQQIYHLHQYINQLNHYLSHLNVYEYYIQGVKVDKVKGTLQFGQLIEKDLIDRDGIHRFYIGEIKISEIEGTGTVGVGVTEKKKKKSEKITPEEASEDIKKIYEEIKQVLIIEQVPTFFQKLAVEKKVLKLVWEKVKEKWNSPTEFNVFYEEVLKRLNKVSIPEVSPSSQKIDENICKKLADSLEAQAKTLLIIIALLHSLLPGYLQNKKKQEAKMSPEKLKIPVGKPNEKVEPSQIFKAIKKGFQLKELPSSFKELEDSPDALRYVFFSMIQPVVESKKDKQYFNSIKEFFVMKSEEMKEDIRLSDLTPDQESFLYSKLIEHLEDYQKYLLLEYLVLPLCNNE